LLQWLELPALCSKSSKRRHPCFGTDLTEKSVILLPLSTMLAVVFLYMFLTQLRKFPLYFFSEFLFYWFYNEWVFNFIKCCPSTDVIIGFLFFSLLICWIIMPEFQRVNSLLSLNKPHFVRV
jgi:hypothetical protein